MRIAVLIISLSLLRGILPAQQTYFSNNYETVVCPNISGSVVEKSDSGFVFVSNNYTSTYPSFSFVSTDKNGDTLFSKTYSFMNSSFSLAPGTHALINCSDGNYLACGSAVDTNNFTDAYIVKFDPTGDTLWTKRFGGGGSQYMNSIYEDYSGKFTVCGSNSGIGNGLSDIWLIKLDQNCSLIWDSVYGTSQNEGGICGDFTIDGGFIVSGRSNNSPFVVKVDSTGAEQWRYTDVNYNGYGYVSCMPDSGYVVGCAKNLSVNETQACLIKLDPDGSVEWVQFVGFVSYADVITTKPVILDSKIVVAGSTRLGNGYNQGFLAKTNLSGNTEWQRRYMINSANHQYVYDMRATLEGGYILSGSCFINTADAWLLKVDSMGCEVAGCDGVGLIELENESRFSVYPNPASNDATVRLTSIGGKETYIEVSNSLGQVVDNISLNGLTTVQLITESYPAGLFHLRLMENGECLASEKLLIIK